MSEGLYANLSWLPEPPPDFTLRSRSACEGEENPGQTLQALAKHRLNASQLARLAKALAKVRAQGKSLAPLTLSGSAC